MKQFHISLSLIVFLTFIGCTPSEPVLEAESQVEDVIEDVTDKERMIGDKNFLTGYEATYENGDVNVVVEIPAGSLEKWEVDKSDGSLRWTYKDGKPRVVNYLGYPGNYGMVPRTLLSKENGGDGDPLDVIVLGAAVERGAVIQCKTIGVLRMLDRGEQDDKLIGVQIGTPFYELDNLDSLDAKYPGTTLMIRTWFENYKGVGKIEVISYGSKPEAQEIIEASITEYNAAQ